jgi:hypothetical protein
MNHRNSGCPDDFYYASHGPNQMERKRNRRNRRGTDSERADRGKDRLDSDSPETTEKIAAFRQDNRRFGAAPPQFFDKFEQREFGTPEACGMMEKQNVSHAEFRPIRCSRILLRFAPEVNPAANTDDFLEGSKYWLTLSRSRVAQSDLSLSR